jgi:hypothetical protein
VCVFVCVCVCVCVLGATNHNLKVVWTGIFLLTISKMQIPMMVFPGPLLKGILRWRKPFPHFHYLGPTIDGHSRSLSPPPPPKALLVVPILTSNNRKDKKNNQATLVRIHFYMEENQVTKRLENEQGHSRVFLDHKSRATANRNMLRAVLRAVWSLE